MKKGRVLILVIFMISVIIIPAQSQGKIRGAAFILINQQQEPLIQETIDYVEHEPIEILNDSAFGLGPVGYNFPGSGTPYDPYQIIEYNITTSTMNLITIEDTTQYFVIRNCF